MSTVTENIAARAIGVPVAIVDVAVGAIATVVARWHGVSGGGAEQNAWAAVCADRARRREWDDIDRRWTHPVR